MARDCQRRRFVTRENAAAMTFVANLLDVDLRNFKREELVFRKQGAREHDDHQDTDSRTHGFAVAAKVVKMFSLARLANTVSALLGKPSNVTFIDLRCDSPVFKLCSKRGGLCQLLKRSDSYLRAAAGRQVRYQQNDR